MFYSTAIPLAVASLAFQASASFSERRGMRMMPREYTVDCARSDADKTLIKTEFDNAAKLAAYASSNLDSGKYTDESFIPKDLFGVVKQQLKDSYGNANKMNSDSAYTFKVTCDEENKFCKNGYYASMSDGKTGTMNICSAFFDVKGTPAEKAGNPDLISTSDITSSCKSSTPGGAKYNNLVDVRLWRAQTLLHEWTHTTFFTGTSEKTIDFAYGPKFCLDLAAGSRKMPTAREWKDKKKTIPYCPDDQDPPQPTYCDKNLAIDNADTLAIIAGAMWLSDAAQCDRELDIGATADPPPPAKLRYTRADPALTEIDIDPPWDGLGFDQGSCSDPDSNGCCGDCAQVSPTPTTSAAPTTSSGVTTSGAPPPTTSAATATTPISSQVPTSA